MSFHLLLLPLLVVIGSPQVQPRMITSNRHPKMNFQDYIKLTASLDTSVVTTSYINGTIFGRIPGSNLKKLFYFEGFNIAKKDPQPDGSYRTLSCELMVYRDLETGEILKVWENPYTGRLNEVFVVDNNPVNADLSYDNVPEGAHLNGGVVVFDSDIMLQYRNPLTPERYPRYSAGPVYIGAELFQWFGSAQDLADPSILSAEVTTTWTRICEWLPWMEMGQTRGNLWYTAFSFKLTNGLKDLPKDIYVLILRKYPEFMKPPTDFDIPNETSWTAFKRVIDKRRAAGLPEIIFPPVDVDPDVPSRGTFVDPSLVKSILAQEEFQVRWSGSIHSLVLGQLDMELFKFRGTFVGKVGTVGEDFVVDVEAKGEYVDPLTGNVLETWLNPMINATLSVPEFHFSGLVRFLEANVGTVYIAPTKEIGLSAVNSYTYIDPNTDIEHWNTDAYQIAFRQHISYISPDDIPGVNPISYYGTWSRASSWLPWMKMDGHQGQMVYRLNIEPTFDKL